MSAPAVIDVAGLSKRFGDTTALEGVDVSVPPGSVLGLLGPNGAGKTTLVRILTTLLDADGGSARVAGLDVRDDADELRALIGLAGQSAAVDEQLTGRENLDLVGSLYGLSRPERARRTAEILSRFGLADVADHSVRTYSGGMRRRLDLGATLVGRPDVIFLDEPTAGLDPRSRANLWAHVTELVAEGATVLLTSQYLEEIDRLADDVVVLDRGRVIARGTPAELKALVGGDSPTLDDVFLALTGHGIAPDEDEEPEPPPPVAPISGADADADAEAGRPRRRRHRLVGDTRATSRREALRMLRSPQLLVFTVAQPLLFVLGFTAIFGGAVALTVTGDPNGRYIDFLLPGSLVIATVFAGSATAFGVAQDRQRGFTDRLRTLPMARSAPLTGRSVADLGRHAFGVVAMVAIAMVLGFRSPAGWTGLLAAVALTLAFGYATVWIYAYIGLLARDPESANAMALMPSLLVVFASSAFVPLDTMPGWLQAVARHQPVTVTIDAVRSAIAGGAPDVGWWPVLAWTVGLLVVFVPLAVHRYDRVAD
jgi:ABC transporter DrrB family efflux protein